MSSVAAFDCGPEGPGSRFKVQGSSCFTCPYPSSSPGETGPWLKRLEGNIFSSLATFLTQFQILETAQKCSKTSRLPSRLPGVPQFVNVSTTHSTTSRTLAVCLDSKTGHIHRTDIVYNATNVQVASILVWQPTSGISEL